MTLYGINVSLTMPHMVQLSVRVRIGSQQIFWQQTTCGINGDSVSVNSGRKY